MNLTVYLGLNVEYSGPRGSAGFTYPLLPLTGLVARYYRLKERWRPLIEQARTAAHLLTIGGKALAWGVL